ncbi:MAG: NlpC/P60 family protein [Lachnospiraceae bacterium]
MLKKKKSMTFIKNCLSFMIVLSLGTVTLYQVNASAISGAQDKIDDAQSGLDAANEQINELEQQQQELQGEIDSSNEELVGLLVDLGILEDELTDKNLQLEEVTVQLGEAQETEKEQYDAMKVRIQFMYERGDKALFETLLESSDFSDFLNRIEYVSGVYEYDRDLLTEYQETVQTVSDLKTTVEIEKAEMEEMQSEYEAQQVNLETLIAQKEAELGDFSSQLASAKATAATYKETIEEQNEIIRQEEERQIKAAEELARQQQEAAQAAESDNDDTTDTPSTVTTDTPTTTTPTDGGANPGFTTGISGSDVVSYATKFVGNPYVWGGTSLTNGADCSGFVMSVYANFGRSLPHSSAALRSVGQEVSYANAQPGDLICYSGHVAIYMGGGRIVHAQSAAVGITTGSATYRTIIAVRRVL